jgi:putative NIF3 family GTP cyclohydrolase 1 type 2
MPGKHRGLRGLSATTGENYMKLSRFLDCFERGLNLPAIHSRAGNDKTRAYLQNDSERIYHGDLLGEVKKIAFMVQPQKDLCLQAIGSGYDTLVSHHRWRPKNSQSPRLGELDNKLKTRGIHMLSFHLYWDIAQGGIADSIMTGVFNIPFHQSLDLTYRGFTIPDLARWSKTSLNFARLSALLEDHYIRTERFLGHLDWTFDRLVVIPGGGLETDILRSLESKLEYASSEKIVVLSSGSGHESAGSYLDFFSEHEKNFSIVDANHYDLEAIGVGLWARKLQDALPGVTCDMFYADHYVSYSI